MPVTARKKAVANATRKKHSAFPILPDIQYRREAATDAVQSGTVIASFIFRSRRIFNLRLRKSRFAYFIRGCKRDSTFIVCSIFNRSIANLDRESLKRRRISNFVLARAV